MRKYIKAHIFAVSVLLALGCSKDEPIAYLHPESINFVKADGLIVDNRSCLPPDEVYAVMIGVNKEGNGKIASTRVEFTLNGVVHSMTFTDDKPQWIPVLLKEGQNIAQLVKTGISTSINFGIKREFVEVE